MTKVFLLKELKKFTEDAVRGVLLPVCMQEGDAEQPPDRPAGVFLMRLAKPNSYTKAAPYVLHQVATGRDAQPEGKQPEGSAVVRSVFCVYDEDGQEGGLALLNLMERLRIALMRDAVLGGQFQLDLAAGMDMSIYPDEDTEPYHIGEIVSTWIMPAPEREVSLYD